jgi:hypothetical protein
MIAALFVARNGTYAGLPDVDPWDEARDARLYPGPHPVVAHPPCTRWCRLAGLVEKRWHGKTVGRGRRQRVASCLRGEDGGCFASALASVRRWGGVLEHPAYSDAWAAHDINHPPTGGGWVNADMVGGWTCYIEQGRYGHPAKKATWLYAHGVKLPSLRWGHVADTDVEALVSWCGNRTKKRAKVIVGRTWREQPRGDFDVRRRLSSKEASATPVEFRDVLIAMARSVK